MQLKCFQKVKYMCLLVCFVVVMIFYFAILIIYLYGRGGESADKDWFMSSTEEPDWRGRLQQALKDRGLKVQAVSLEAGLHKNYVSRVISGQNSTVDNLSRVCDVIGIRMAYLFQIDGEIGLAEEAIKMTKGMSESEAQKVIRILESSRRD